MEYKKDQNWVRKSGNYFVFPGGGTQFKNGVTAYIRFIEQVDISCALYVIPSYVLLYMLACDGALLVVYYWYVSNISTEDLGNQNKGIFHSLEIFLT